MEQSRGRKQRKRYSCAMYNCFHLLMLIFNFIGFSVPLWITENRKHDVYIKVIYLFLGLHYATFHTPTLYFLPAKWSFWISSVFLLSFSFVHDVTTLLLPLKLFCAQRCALQWSATCRLIHRSLWNCKAITSVLAAGKGKPVPVRL